jgi:uncharacterized protein YbbK (DUF523 family)
MRRELPATGRILVSACLAGRACAYDGSARPDETIMRLVAEGRAVLVCPEEEGGLGTPRPAAEIQPDGRVLTKEGRDVTKEYRRGAEIAVDRARANGCAAAVLKARSPACGCGAVYDGSFTRTLREGDGVTAAALKRAGVEILTDEDVF